jgi:RNA polymerase sigma-70 factor (ECF subfamily)
MNGEDAALVGRCLAGDDGAFRPLVEKYHDPLFRVARRMLGNTDDARHSTESAFVKAFEHLSTFDPRQRFFSWIYRILLNECLLVLRARNDTAEPDRLPPADEDPFARAHGGEIRQQVRTAIRRLPAEQREMIVLRHFGGLSYREIAQATALPEKTVKLRLFAARQQLAALLPATGASE